MKYFLYDTNQGGRTKRRNVQFSFRLLFNICIRNNGEFEIFVGGKNPTISI